MSVSENIDFLTPGSVWLREADGSVAKFLMLTNTSLKKKTQEQHPPQVIYVDAQGNFYNRRVEDFFKVYTFHSVDGDLERRLESLIQFNEADLEHVHDPEDEPVSEVADALINEVVDEVPGELSAPAFVEQFATDPSRSLNVYFGLIKKEDTRMPVLSAADLNDALVHYSQNPNQEYGITEHRLMFSLGGPVTIESLTEAFHPSLEVSTYDWFDVHANEKSEAIVWESWIGVYPEYSIRGLYATVIVGVPDASATAAETTTMMETLEAASREGNPVPLEMWTAAAGVDSAALLAEVDPAVHTAGYAQAAPLTVPAETTEAELNVMQQAFIDATAHAQPEEVSIPAATMSQTEEIAMLVQSLGLTTDAASELAADAEVMAAIAAVQAKRREGTITLRNAEPVSDVTDVEATDIVVEPAFSPETAAEIGLNQQQQ
ncbi:hypothetical protein BcepSauron_231 [Burkholderia phage BcepSauron]|uniref:Uncharacterized protein n=1 Tax=Burkholderia phage BcepSauron TaxID=2530033 RepID=A0A482MKN8_9CAUD|nr:hypothetical protein H1O17_gp231 [Burkholderia phage BcepSauron]QBQ74611.1 hypothetical protein BcepSauron_231 [Burkholderia phage BcepSauron]